MSKEHSPIPIRISDLDAKNKIVYCCPKCGEVFSFCRNEEQFCHKCNNQIDWHGVPTYLTDEQKKKEREIYLKYQTKQFDYKKYKREMIEILLEVYKSYV